MRNRIYVLRIEPGGNLPEVRAALERFNNTQYDSLAEARVVTNAICLLFPEIGTTIMSVVPQIPVVALRGSLRL